MATAARKTASKVTDKSFNPSAKAIAAVASGVPGKSARTVKIEGRIVAPKIVKPAAAKKPVVTTGKKPAARVGQLAKDMAREINDGATYDKKTTPLKEQRKMDEATKKARAALDAGKAPAVFEKAVKAGLKAARKPKADKEAKALDKIVKNKKVAKEKAVTFRGFVIPVNRKSTDSEDSVPTISVKNVADTIKLFEKLPKGCTWLADTSAATKDTLNLYNKSGAYIAEVRITK